LRYALGELAGTEALEFETRLETDQAARDALADAVILSSAVRQLPRPSRSTAPVHQPAARRSRIATMVSCAAACLLLIVLIKLPNNDRPIAHRNGVEATTIFGTWSDLGEEEISHFDTDADLARDDSSSDIPDWMVAAVLEDIETAPLKEGTL
jgi:anti-sigma factor RsiW